MVRKNHKGFGIYYDATKQTSGQRFFGDLTQELCDVVVPLEKNPSAILFNVSAPIKAILNAKFKGQKVVLRIDSLYFDRLSIKFIAAFKPIFRPILNLGLRYPSTHNFFAFLANLFKENYTSFARILLADFIIYQSDFSRVVHQKYFPRKPFDVIVNGSYPKEFVPRISKYEGFQLVTIYDDYRPSKRIHEIVNFVEWANTVKKTPVSLTILGYTGNIPKSVPDRMKDIIDNSTYIKTIPRFSSFSGEAGTVLLSSDVYITFSFRDSCPNAVVEAMAHGLPVVAVNSGGLPDIVGNAGILLDNDDFTNGFYTAHRFEDDFPKIDFDNVLDAISKICSETELYSTRVHERFSEVLDLKKIAERYTSAMRLSE